MMTIVPRYKSDVSLIVLSLATKLVLESFHDWVKGFLVVSCGMAEQKGYSFIAVFTTEYVLIDRQRLRLLSPQVMRMNGDDVDRCWFEVHAGVK